MKVSTWSICCIAAKQRRTKLRVSHMLLKAAGSWDDSTIAEALEIECATFECTHQHFAAGRGSTYSCAQAYNSRQRLGLQCVGLPELAVQPL